MIGSRHIHPVTVHRCPENVFYCPVCTYPLRGESIDYARQVVEIPPPSPVEITEHQVVKRWCPHCNA